MEQHLRTATLLANLLDNSFNFFGKKFGLNGVLGLVPGAGDIITTGLSLYIVWIGIQMGLPLIKIIEMIKNVAINFFIGLLPVLGDAVDFFHKANLKNLKIIREYVKDKDIIEGEVLTKSGNVAIR